MRIGGDGYRAMLAGALLAAVAGCAGSSGQIAGSSALPRALPASRGHSQSYMLPQARNAKYLLYVSSFYYGIVHVFDFRTRAVVGEINGFNEPTGQCVDAKGDIWIAEADGHQVVEYPRASLKQIRAVQTYARPFGCSVAPNGDLAVADFDEGSAPGDVEVFKNGSGKPVVYKCNGFGYYPNSPGYDDKGNLFVEGLVSLQQDQIGLCVLPAGGSSLNPVDAGIAFHEGGGAMWDGKYMTLADVFHDQNFRDSTAIYRVSTTASGGITWVGTTVLRDTRIPQPFILGTKNTPVNLQQGFVLVGPDNYHITRWKYPSGVKNSVPYVIEPNDVPFGESISIGI